MTPDIETTIQNVLKASGMFTDAQVSMAIVTLDPVVSSIEEERDENLKMLQGFRTRAHNAEDALEAAKNQAPSPDADDNGNDPSPFNDTPYMTIIPARYPEKKVHASLSLAKNAVSYHTNNYSGGNRSEYRILEFKNNRWVDYLVLPKGAMKKDIPWRKGR